MNSGYQQLYAMLLGEHYYFYDGAIYIEDDISQCNPWVMKLIGGSQNVIAMDKRYGLQ
jgi:hypothetical protein